MSDPGHGSVGQRVQSFTHLLPLRAMGYNPHDLADLAAKMKSDVDSVKDGGDPEENLCVPAGYTYFGQFIDHDLTFDSTSSLDPNSGSAASNLRTPRFDLDCVYGDGPDAQPFMYGDDGATLLYRQTPSVASLAKKDLARAPESAGLSIIGDKRNDENSIVCQIQLSFIKYHNAVVHAIKQKPNHPKGGALFAAARNEVRWTYQKLVVEDFLPRIVRKQVFADLTFTANPNQSKQDMLNARDKNYALYTADKRSNLPLEFVGAAYRYGHSGVRTGYRMNAQVDIKNAQGKVTTKGGRFSIFPASNDATKNAGADSLLGFDPLPSNQEIDHWGRFFPDYLPNGFGENDLLPKAVDETENTAVRLQFAYKIDTNMVDPLGVLPRGPIAGEGNAKHAEAMLAPTPLPDPLASSTFSARPSLALLNLLRGNTYRIASGQDVAIALKAKGLPCDVLSTERLVIRTKQSDGSSKFEKIAPVFLHDTPLWFYVLAEAQKDIVDQLKLTPFNEDALLSGPAAKTQLGWVGGRIVAEVFYGLLDSDNESYVNAAPANWQPMLGGDKKPIFRNLLKFADSSNS